MCVYGDVVQNSPTPVCRRVAVWKPRKINVTQFCFMLKTYPARVDQSYTGENMNTQGQTLHPFSSNVSTSLH